MDSFLALFDPGPSTPTFGGELWPDDEEEGVQLPPEPQLGNVEYKLKLVTPSKLRFEHLVTQLKWRLREGRGEAIYEIGVEDTGLLTGLSEADMVESIQTLEQMALKLGATITVLRERQVDSDKKVAEVLVRKVPDDASNIELRVAVMGSGDAGKSTLVGVLTQGSLDNGRGRSRLNMFRHLHEIRSGRTSSISHEVLGFDARGGVINYSEAVTAEEICENSSKLVTFLDLAGHRKYLRTTVAGLSGYSPHHVLLVVSAAAGVVGMTREHLALAMALETPFFVVVTKIDLTCEEEAVLARVQAVLTSAACRRIPFVVRSEDDVITASSNTLADNIVPIFCVSNVTGRGLDLLSSFLYLLPPGVSSKERERLEQEVCEFQIDETFKVPEVGLVVGGLLTRGVITEGAPLYIGPDDTGTFTPVTVTSLHRNKAPCRIVRASQAASLCLTPSVSHIRHGMVLLGRDTPQSVCLFFQASIVVLFHSTQINTGFQTTVHIGNIRQTAVIEGILGPGPIHTNDTASVMFRFVRHPEYVREGMRLLFREGMTKGIGKITQVFPL